MTKEESPSDSFRFPLRMRWTLLVGSVVAGIVFLLTLFIIDMERGAWQKSQDRQSIILTKRLASELSIPMVSASQKEVEHLIGSFLENISEVTTVTLKWNGIGDFDYGKNQRPPSFNSASLSNDNVVRIDDSRLWYATLISYGDIEAGILMVRFSEASWHGIDDDVKHRLLIVAAIAILLSTLLVYWVAGRMSRPIELIAEAEKHVANGNFSIRLPVKGNDEIGAAMKQFNSMVAQLEHKEMVRDAFGRYLNPELIAGLFDDVTAVPRSHNQDVTILFADMVDFTAYSQSARPEAVVDVLNEHFELFYHIIDTFGGHVDKYIGDALMAVFNHPFEDKDHILHAVMAGLAMEQACQELSINRPDGNPVRFRIGIDRGQAIVGNIGARKRLEYTVIGNTVNIASRMASLGIGVNASEEVFNELGFGFKMDEIRDEQIKGVEHPIHCGRIEADSKKVKTALFDAVTAAFEAKEKSDRDNNPFETY